MRDVDILRDLCVFNTPHCSFILLACKTLGSSITTHFLKFLIIEDIGLRFKLVTLLVLDKNQWLLCEKNDFFAKLKRPQKIDMH